jgi:aldose 1-epimerase
VDGEVGVLRPAAAVVSDKTGISMQVYTTQPGVQLYTANFLNEGLPGKNGCAYGPRHAFCLETQHFPDSPNQTNFPSVILHAGETYKHRTEFVFSNANTI